MNKLKGQIQSIKSHEHLSQVAIKLKSTVFQTIVIETTKSADYLVEGKEIHILFKETELVISKNEGKDLCIQNKLKATLSAIERGELLSKLELKSEEGPIRAIILTDAVNALNLTVNDSLWVLIKSTEIMLSV